MARVKRGVTKKAKHKKILKATKGYRGTKGTLYRVSKEALLHAGQYAYAGRRLRRRDARANWIRSISAALFDKDIKYSQLIKFLKEANITLDRKILAEIATNDPQTFEKILEKIQK